MLPEIFVQTFSEMWSWVSDIFTSNVHYILPGLHIEFPFNTFLGVCWKQWFWNRGETSFESTNQSTIFEADTHRMEKSHFFENGTLRLFC